MQTIVITAETAQFQTEDFEEFQRLRRRIFPNPGEQGHMRDRAGFGPGEDAPAGFALFLLKAGRNAVGLAELVACTQPPRREPDATDKVQTLRARQATDWEIRRLGVRTDLPPTVTEPAMLRLLSDAHDWCRRSGIARLMLVTALGTLPLSLESTAWPQQTD